jgi:hypothetical protein
MTVTLANSGGSTLNLATVAFSGANAADFAIASGATCTNGSTVNAGASCTAGVTFKPGALGARAATLTFTDDSGGTAGTTQTVALTGTGIDFTLTGPATPITVVAGKSAPAVFTIAPAAGGFPSLITFSVSGLPSATTGTFDHPTLTPGNATATSTLTIQTTASSVAPPAFSSRRRMPSLPVQTGLLSLAVVLALMGFTTLRQGVRRRQILAYLPFALLLIAGALTAGCTGGRMGTPKGSTTVTVTATAGSLSHTATFTLTVQ